MPRVEILTGEQMRRADRRAIDELGIPEQQLMEAAGRGVAERMLAGVPDLGRRPVVVLCGGGNNGGDGLVVARHLAGAGVSARTLLLVDPGRLRGAARDSLDAARAAGLIIEHVTDDAGWDRAAQAIRPGALIVDALLGTGVHGPARGLIGRAIEHLLRSGVEVVSVDLPSGADADVGTIAGPVVRARRTYTLCRPKRCLVLEPAAACAGAWSVVDIGIPDACVAAERDTLEWLDADAAATLLPARAADAHKGRFGHLLVVAGSRGKSGAAVLVARGALRAGAGRVPGATPGPAQPLVAVQQAEVMTEPLPATAGGALARDGGRVALDLLASRSALALGPGLGTAEETAETVRHILRERSGPGVVDADGLNAMTSWSGVAASSLVLTPHPGEAARMLGGDTAGVQSDRLAAAQALAARTGAVVALKGRRTVIAAPDGRTSINASGNPGMATAGTGDVLTGVVGAFLARGLAPFDAARLAVFAHGDAGDRAARRRGEDGIIAGDLADMLPRALAALARRRETA